jgi:putative DNA primase/helicase
MTPEQLLHSNGIDYRPGKDRYYATCPHCSHLRKLAHQKLECLGVTIEGDSARWGCNHCSWTGPTAGASLRSMPPTTSYRYGDSLRKVRNPSGGPSKFYWQHINGKGTWDKGAGGADTKSLLYRIDEVREAIAAGEDIAIVEGEKDADTLWHLGIAATCNAHGASETGKKPKWLQAHSDQLRGADLLVFNDNDSTGYAHADTVSKLSLGIAKRVRRLDLKNEWPEIPIGSDVTDWLEKGRGTAQRLRELIDQTPDWHKVGNGAEAATPEAELERLARLSPFDYERVRKSAAEKLGVRASMLDRGVAAKRAELGLDDDDDGLQGSAVTFEEIEPWPEPVDGSQLLDDLATTFREHVVMLDYERDICALWNVHTYIIKHFKISPKLSIKSAVRECGKSTLLEVLNYTVYRPWATESITPAALFRVIAKWQPTLLIDEVDTFVSDNEELRGMLNASHRYDGAVTRTVGDEHEPRRFLVYASIALSGIGGLADTLANRSVTIVLKRRRPNEPIAQLRIGRMGRLEELRRRAVRWVADHEEHVAARDPKMPAIVINREADNWQVLLAIADEAGGKWPERARRAAEQHHNAVVGDDSSRLELLLGDIRTIRKGKTEMPSDDLVKALVAIESHPWAEMGKSGKPLTQNRLARMLRPVSITTENIRVQVGDRGGKMVEKVVKGYVFKHFEDAFARYLPPEGVSEPLQRYNADEMDTSFTFQTATPDPDVADGECEKSNNDGACSIVAVSKRSRGGNGQSHPCQQCKGEPDGTEREHTIDGERVWLHAECEPFWRNGWGVRR